MPENEKMILSLILIFTACMVILMLFFFMLINLYRKRLERQKNDALNNLIIGQDNERERLARDMHDQLGPNLSSIAALVTTVKPGKPELQELLDEVKEELWKSVQDVRNISHDLMTTSLKKYGLLDAIRKLIKRSVSENLQIDLIAINELDGLNDQISAHIYRISQELVYNTIKHSGANKAEMHFDINISDKTLQFNYKDNGKGNPEFDLKNAGIGLSNIKTRVSLMGGEIQIDMENGFKCQIKIKY